MVLYVQPAVIAVVIAGHLAPYHLQAALVLAGLQAAKPRQVGYQVARVVVGRADDVQQALAFHVQVHHDVLLPVQVKALEKDHAAHPFHRLPSPGSSAIILPQMNPRVHLRLPFHARNCERMLHFIYSLDIVL